LTASAERVKGRAPTSQGPAATLSTADAGGGGGPGIEPLNRRTLHDEVVDRVRTLVIEGQLAPGSRIHESQLGNALGVSRTPLREALKVLASEGLIELVPGRGAVVKRLTHKDVRDMLDVLVALETLAGRLACRNATDSDIGRLRALHDEMMALYAAGNRLEYYWRNQAIHAGLAALSGNALLGSLHHAISARLKRIRFIGNEEPDKWAGAVAEHEAMIAALEARDEVLLADVIRRHLDQTWLRVVEKI
jgi:DNA-binding GntR family transcriptional regulator